MTFEEMKNQIICGDCLIQLKSLPENSFDSIVTDPPYHLVSIVKRFGKQGSAPAQHGKDGSFSRLSKGFMGKEWDGVDENGMGIANNPEMWKECLRVLKPGGHLLAFSGTRTYHRMAVAIEDAGFEVRDMIEWVYGSGFPKGLNIGKAVDKLQGNEREVVGKIAQPGSTNKRISMGNGWQEEPDLTKGTSEWEGWGTALKPAHEPICMARKPLSEKTVAENVLKYGTGGINIDESRVDAKPRKTGTKPTSDEATGSGNTLQGSSKNRQAEYDELNLGRFPSNLIHDNSEEVRECFPNESERFFKSILYYPKASKSERNKGCEGLEEKEEVYPGINTFDESGNRLRADGSVIPPLKSKNNHPTVKPIALMEYLIKMVTPCGGIVLDPFAGSGSTLVAAKQNGYQYIGIELTPEYIPIIEARLKGKIQATIL